MNKIRPIAHPRAASRRTALAALASLTLLAACGGSDDNTVAPEETRPQDARVFTPVAEATFAALGNSAVATDRWTGALNGADGF